MAKSAKTQEKNIVEENVEPSPFVVVSEFVSPDKSLKAVLRRNKMTSFYEIDFYNGKKIVATESYAFHTRKYHEDAAENYVNGIKKL